MYFQVTKETKHHCDVLLLNWSKALEKNILYTQQTHLSSICIGRSNALDNDYIKHTQKLG